MIGTLNVNLRYNTQERKLPLVVVFGNATCLLRRNWLQHIKLSWSAVHYLSTYPDVQSLLGRYSDLFKPGLGMIKNVNAKIYVDHDT